MSKQKAEIPAADISTIFDQAVRDVISVGESNRKLKGAVDIGITFRNVHVDRTGVLASVFGRQNSDESTIEVKLATRIVLEDLDHSEDQ
ncbi:MAG: hypothetical protein AAFX93_13875 [Verrucomicrobiota bacterium]